MPEEQEIETSDLQEAIEELHHERSEREAEEHRNAWTKYVGLATAIFAVFAALGSLQSASLVNEAMIQQIKASDKWNEYQADRSKIHLFDVQAAGYLDQGVTAAPAPKGELIDRKLSQSERLGYYLDQVKRETGKTADISKDAKELEKDSANLMVKHHRFAYAVTGIQVAIALGAVSALTKMKWIWLLSIVFGLAGIVMFIQGFL
jgi:hypothetical protein